MKIKYNIDTRFFVMLVASIIIITSLFPGVFGNTNIKSETLTEDNEEITSEPSDSLLGSGSIVQNLLSIIRTKRSSPLGFLSGVIHTTCNGYEKSSEINFLIQNDIDIDDDPNTGVNGADIRVRYLILPKIELDTDIGIGLLFSLKVERLGDEIKDDEFSASLETGASNIRLGFKSPDETSNEIPRSAEVTFKIMYYLIERVRGFGVSINPVYDTGNENKKIELTAEYVSEEITRGFSLAFEPPIQTEFDYRATNKQGVWEYDFNRKASGSCKLSAKITKIQNGIEKEKTLTINPLPTEMIFSLGITPLSQGGGQLLYESNEMYDIELRITSSDLGECGYSLLSNTPRRIFAEWTPTFYNGRYYLDMDSDGTDFILRNSPTNPTIELIVNNLETVGFDAYWNLSNPGDIIVYNKSSELFIDLEFKIGNWIVQLNAQPEADFIYASWEIANDGHLEIDTDWEPFATAEFLIQGLNVGLKITGETFKAENFRVDWVIWPPYIHKSGYLDFVSISIDIFFNGKWHHIWPILP